MRRETPCRGDALALSAQFGLNAGLERRVGGHRSLSLQKRQMRPILHRKERSRLSGVRLEPHCVEAAFRSLTPIAQSERLGSPDSPD